MKAYFISGLAADRRVFSKVELAGHFEAVYLDWLPVMAGESLQEYALRLAEPIEKNEHFVLIGLSFGGVVAIEISEVYKPVKLILISSVANQTGIPLAYRFVGRFRLETLVPKRMLALLRPCLFWFFGPLSTDAKRLLGEFIENADYQLLKWSLGKISRWKSKNIPADVIQIHGYQDRVFPASLSGALYLVKGGHLCVYDNSKEVNAVLRRVLS